MQEIYSHANEALGDMESHGDGIDLNHLKYHLKKIKETAWREIELNIRDESMNHEHKEDQEVLA